VVTRGEVWWVDLAAPIGSAPGHRRPALVVASDRFNRSRIATTIVAAITSDMRLEDAPGNVALPEDLLPKPSVVNVSQLLTIDRGLLERRVDTVSPTTMRRIDRGLRLVLGL
jgi:mRNA interferase MazF